MRLSTTNMDGPSEADRLREACRSKDALFARLNALVDAVETAKDGEEHDMALNAFAQQKSGIARRLSQLVDSLEVGQEITRPLEEVDVAPCRKMHTVLVAGAALGVPAPASVEQAAATRRDASEERAAPNNATISMSHLEMAMSVATTRPQIRPPRSDDSPVEELQGRDLQIEPPVESCTDELTGHADALTGRAHAADELTGCLIHTSRHTSRQHSAHAAPSPSLESSLYEEAESFRVPHSSRKSPRKKEAPLTFFPSDDPAVARALLKQTSLPVLKRTQGAASPREDTPLNWSNQLRLQPRSLARWPRTVRHSLAQRIAKGRELLRLPRLPAFDLALATAFDIFFGWVDRGDHSYPAYNRF